MVLFPHGGPWYRDYWGFNPFWNCWPTGMWSFHPSPAARRDTGKISSNAGKNKQWGEKTRDDLTWGVKYLYCSGYRRPQTCVDHGRVLWGLCDAGRCGLYTRDLCRSRVLRRSVESSPPHRIISAYLEGSVSRAYGVPQVCRRVKHSSSVSPRSIQLSESRHPCSLVQAPRTRA